MTKEKVNKDSEPQSDNLSSVPSTILTCCRPGAEPSLAPLLYILVACLQLSYPGSEHGFQPFLSEHFPEQPTSVNTAYAHPMLMSGVAEYTRT